MLAYSGSAMYLQKHRKSQKSFRTIVHDKNKQHDIFLLATRANSQLHDLFTQLHTSFHTARPGLHVVKIESAILAL
jgi:hypothetical protein